MILKKSSPIKHGKLIAMVVTLMTAMTFALIYQDTQSPPHEDDYVVGVFSDNSQNHSEIESRYELLRNSILDTSDEESVRNSIDWFFQNSHQEIAVLLSSEVLRYKGHANKTRMGQGQFKPLPNGFSITKTMTTMEYTDGASSDPPELSDVKPPIRHSMNMQSR